MIAPFLRYRDASGQKSQRDVAAAIQEQRPVLQPILVIDSVNTNGVGFHFEVENRGKTTAYNIRQQHARNGDFQGNIITHESGNELASKAEMRISSPLKCCRGDNYISADLVVAYDGKFETTNASFRSLHRFHVMGEDLKPGRFFQNHGEVEAGARKLFDKDSIILSALRLPVGSVQFTVSDKDSRTGAINRYRAVSRNREIYIDCSNRVVTFISGEPGNRKVLKLPLARPDKHGIILSWSTNMAYLSVDGAEVADPTNYLRESERNLK